MKKNVLLIHTGGTIGMTRDSRSGVLRPDRFSASLLQVIPELSAIADVQVEIPFVCDSAEIHFSHWQQLAAIIQSRVGQVDGVVVTHGTDTLAYTAAALSFMLHNVPIPVILTGAQRPLGELRSDARNNLVNAVELACADIPEVCIFFDYKLLRGNRTRKNHINFFDAFASPNYPLLAEVGINIEVYRNNLLRPGGHFHVFDRFSPALAVLKLFPGCDAGYFQPGADVRAVLLVAFGAGTALCSAPGKSMIQGSCPAPRATSVSRLRRGSTSTSTSSARLTACAAASLKAAPGTFRTASSCSAAVTPSKLGNTASAPAASASCCQKRP